MERLRDAIWQHLSQIDWVDRLQPVVVSLLFFPLSALVLSLVRRTWMAGLQQMPVDRLRAERRVETIMAFVRSVVYFALVIVSGMELLHALLPGFNPWAATGALSIVALILTGMFRDLVVDVAKGIDILLGHHYSVGDFIRVAGRSGYVVDFQLKFTKLLTPSGEEVVINNANCIPSQRFPQGWVTNHVDIPLAQAGDAERARELLERVGRQVSDQVEALQDRPKWESTTPSQVDTGVRLRYALHVLPGASWVLDDYYLPAVRRALEAAELPLADEITYFFMNDIAAFRRRFGRTGGQPVPEEPGPQPGLFS